MTRSTSTTEPAASRQRPSPCLVLALLAALGWLLLGSGKNTETAPTQSQLAQIEEELFGETARCSAGDARAGQRLAELAEARATSRGERYPFHPASGPWAVRLWGEAEACWVLAEAPDRARTAASLRQAWRGRVSRDFRAHQLRLERAKSAGRPAEALAETKALRALFDNGRDSPARTSQTTGSPSYLDWLAREERRLESTRGK